MGDRDPGPGDDRPLGRVRWFLGTDDEAVRFLREVAAGLLMVVLAGLVLYAVSGVWPPMVAVESPSMTPNLQEGDLVFVVEEHRFGSPAAVPGTGVVTRRAGADVAHTSFGEPGDVIVFRPDGSDRRTPVIHRAHFWVNRSENWYAKAEPRYAGGEDCAAVPNCPAPHAGFVTKGDANDRYDQVGGVSGPVRSSWVEGTAELRIPYLGRVRLIFSRVAG